MDKLNYCVDCKRIFNHASVCSYCNSENVKELAQKAPVNVIGTKLKGRLFKVHSEKAQILIIDEKQSKSVKEFEASKLQKVL